MKLYLELVTARAACVRGSHSQVPRPVSMIDDGGLAVGAHVSAKSREREREREGLRGGREGERGGGGGGGKIKKKILNVGKY